MKTSQASGGAGLNGGGGLGGMGAGGCGFAQGYFSQNNLNGQGGLPDGARTGGIR